MNVLITGGSSGIGKLLAEKFAAEGNNIAITSNRIGNLLQTMKELTSKYPDVRIIACTADSSMLPEVQRAVKRVIKEFGQIHVLVNNAGQVGPIGMFTNNKLKAWLHTIEVNMFGMVYYSHIVLKHMQKYQFGRIVNILGGGAKSPRPTLSSYGTSKAACLRFTTSVGLELMGTGITMNGIGPGVVDTKLIWQIINAPGLDPAYKKKQEDKFKNKQDTPPDKLFELIKSLTDKNLTITGEIFEVYNPKELQVNLDGNAKRGF